MSTVAFPTKFSPLSYPSTKLTFYFVEATKTCVMPISRSKNSTRNLRNATKFLENLQLTRACAFFLNTRAELYEIPAPHFYPTPLKEPVKRQRAFFSNEASQINPRDYCTNPICVSANTHRNRTVAVCTRNSANPYRSNFRPRGKGKGKGKRKIKGKGRGGARNFSQARGLNPEGMVWYGISVSKNIMYGIIF